MARGEVRYRLTLDSNVKEQAEKAASAMKTAGAESKAALATMGGAFDEHTSKLGKVAGAVDITSKKMASLGEAAGLPVGPLRAISDVADLADVGLSNLSKGMAGFNAASVGVAGAGLAIGAAIGAWLNTFPAVRAEVDRLRDSVTHLFGAMTGAEKMQQAMAGIGDFQKNAAAVSAEVTAKQIARFKELGMTMEEIAKIYNDKVNPNTRTAAEVTKDLAEKEKLATEAAKKYAAEMSRLGQEAWKAAQKSRDEWDKFFTEIEKHGAQAMKDLNAGFDKFMDQQKEIRALGDKADLNALLGIKNVGSGGLFASGDVLKDLQSNEAAIQDVRGATIDWGFAVDDVSDALRMMGLEKVADQIDDISNSFLKGAQIGSQFGGGGALIGGGIGALLGLGGKLFGGGEEKQINPLRQQFVDAAGGLDALNVKAHEAGLTLDKLLRADTVKEYEAAIKELTGAFDLQTQAQSELDAAAQKYGFTTQHQIDMQAGDLLKSWELLTAAGFSNTEITKAMADDLNSYFQTTIAAGQQIPENFRPIAEQMASLGLLTNAAGETVDGLADAGITGFGSMTESVKTLVEEIRKLVAALRGMPEELPNYGGGGGGSNGPPHGGPHDYEEGFAEGTDGFMNFGKGTPTTLHGMEAVVTPGGFADIAKMMAGYMNTGGGGGCSGHDIVMDGATVARMTQHRQDMGYGKSKRRTRRL